MRRIEGEGDFVMLAAYRFYDESLEPRTRTLMGWISGAFFRKPEKHPQVLETTGAGRLRVMEPGFLLRAFVAAAVF